MENKINLENINHLLCEMSDIFAKDNNTPAELAYMYGIAVALHACGELSQQTLLDVHKKFLCG